MNSLMHGARLFELQRSNIAKSMKTSEALLPAKPLRVTDPRSVPIWATRPKSLGYCRLVPPGPQTPAQRTTFLKAIW